MIAIINYKAGNTTSVVNAIARMGEVCIVTDDPVEILQADKVILPGVGAAGSAMKSLQSKGLDQTIKQIETPFLGICLGLQLMCNYSEEDEIQCLGLFDTVVKKFPPENKVPHMGWNEHTSVKGSLFEGISASENFYFVHSYYAEPCDEQVATCNYINGFASAIQRDNYYGVQFHPEKSADIGTQLLQNFLNL